MYRHAISNKIINTVRHIWNTLGGGQWLVAVSGGADSSALLLACSNAGVPVRAVHCNFNLRGKESIRDRDFTVMLCDSLNIPLSVKECDVAAETAKGESLEMTCRRIRYDFFLQLKENLECSHIAVAHNADDNAETLFLNLFRGSGAKGLKGMDTVTTNLVRPLLSFGRKDILQFLKEQKQDFIVDSTNLESDYRRNFIRNDIFPLLESRWVGVRAAIKRSQEILAREHRITEYFISSVLSPYSDFLPWEVILNFPDPETLVFRFIEKFGGTPAIAAEISRHALAIHPGKRWSYRSTTFLSTKKGLKAILQ